MRHLHVLLNKYKIAIYTLFIFSMIGIVAMLYRDIRYFFLFFGIGLLDSTSRILVVRYPKLLQFFRLTLLVLIGSSLFAGICLIIGVNFQFIEIFFDLSAWVVTGALIQLIVARLILPFFAGNAFCSRACWNGAFFEFTNPMKKKTNPKKRSPLLAWGYLLFLVVLGFTVAFLSPVNPAENQEVRMWWIIGENILIIFVGFFLSISWGSRAYCRTLCPFITISSLIAPYSLLKITPVAADQCTSCNACNNACPMYIDVLQAVKDRKRVNDSMCILCERCVSSCKLNVLKVATKMPKPHYDKETKLSSKRIAFSYLNLSNDEANAANKLL
ncbi:MAG: hypothetical protein DRI88_06755 [Bacteroidetes bacterium]|nr:MAG: hypothetical protein DRI88_06755 [Bacteroidota bacterium]